ncbi:hypothetical protein D6833_09765 [Candidatus Parcubacteria bacterium]|nr:MAG: hypothetical protein D6833_09765 [Candidatus Parcubacteria bacterium]
MVSKGTENGLAVLKTRIEKPMQFPVVAAGHYHVYDGSHDGLSCTVTSYATGKEKHARRLQNNFFAAATYYASLFGMPYPFDHQDVIEVNSWGFGQAPPGVIFITQEAFSPLQDTLTRIFSGGVNERFVHEIAHAYWGHVIKMPNLEEQWLTESFAEYSAAMCIEAMNSNRKKGRKAFAKILNSWKGGVKTMGEGGSIFLANHFSGEQDTDAMDRIHLLYHKGPLVLHAIRLDLRKRFGKEKGDKAFIILLRAFLKNFPYQYGATHHLIGILNQLTKSDWQPWFDRYVFGTEVPPLG